MDKNQFLRYLNDKLNISRNSSYLKDPSVDVFIRRLYTMNGEINIINQIISDVENGLFDEKGGDE